MYILGQNGFFPVETLFDLALYIGTRLFYFEFTVVQ